MSILEAPRRLVWVDSITMQAAQQVRDPLSAKTLVVTSARRFHLREGESPARWVALLAREPLV